MAAANASCTARSTGRCFTLVLAGYLSRQLSPFQFLEGRIGLGTNPPPQFGQTPPRIVSTQVAQNVHSKLQIRASSGAGRKGLVAVLAGGAQFQHGGLLQN